MTDVYPAGLGYSLRPVHDYLVEQFLAVGPDSRSEAKVKGTQLYTGPGRGRSVIGLRGAAEHVTVRVGFFKEDWPELAAVNEGTRKARVAKVSTRSRVDALVPLFARIYAALNP